MRVSASAAPGVSYDNGTGAVGIGDQEQDSGAFAQADEGNNALALSVFSPATAIAQGRGNNVVAVDGLAMTGPNSAKNNVFSGPLGISLVDGSYDDPDTEEDETQIARNNNVVTVFGATDVRGDSHDNTILNVGGLVESEDQGDAAGALSVSVCGTSFSRSGCPHHRD